MRVSVYFNLHNGLWSVRNDETGRVIGHATRVLLRDARFTVSAAGRARVLRDGVKNVHAFVRGTLESADWETERDARACHYKAWQWSPRGNAAYLAAAERLGRAVTYNPFKGPTFTFRDDGTAAMDSPMVAMVARTRGVLAFDPCGMTAEESARASL